MYEFLLSIILYLFYKDMSFLKILLEVLGRFWGEGEGSYGKDIYRFVVFDLCIDLCGERIGVF